MVQWDNWDRVTAQDAAMLRVEAQDAAILRGVPEQGAEVPQEEPDGAAPDILLLSKGAHKGTQWEAGTVSVDPHADWPNHRTKFQLPNPTVADPIQ